MQYLYKYIERYNPGRKLKVSTVFRDVTGLFIRGKKINISIVLLQNLILKYRKM